LINIIISKNRLNHKKAYKILKIDFESQYDEDNYSSQELPTSEFENGTKHNANTPKGNSYFKDNPFHGLSQKGEKANHTIDSTVRITDDRIM